MAEAQSVLETLEPYMDSEYLLSGDVSNIRWKLRIDGDASNIRWDVSNIFWHIGFISGDVSNISWCVDNLGGDVSNLTGDVSNINVFIK
jgi:hypothetical protein